MKHVSLRLPDDLHGMITEAARQDVRSLNGEIIHLLRLALERDSGSAEKPHSPPA